MAHDDSHSTGNAGANCLVCEFDPFVRNNYFTGKMMGAGEFVAETQYHSEKLRHHHVRLHGWGVVCGLKVTQHPAVECRPRYVLVEPGSAIDCCGHEILVPDPEYVEVSAFPAVKKLAQSTTAALHALTLCVRFRECPTEDVPALYDDCGCDDTKCLPNRILESYEFDVMVDPPLTPARPTADAIFGAIAATPAGARWAAVAQGKLYAIDPTDTTQLMQIDLAGHKTTRLALGAKGLNAIASADGQKVFVVTEGKGGATQRVLMNFAAANGKQLGADRNIPDTGASSTVLLAVSGSLPKTLLTLVAQNGKMHTWKDDPIVDLNTAPGQGVNDPVTIGTAPSNLAALIAQPDGARAYAVDGVSRAITVLDLSGPNLATQAVNALPTTAKANALSYVKAGTTDYLAVTSAPDQQLFIIKPDFATPANSTVPFTLPLAHTPQFVMAPDPNWIQVYERDAANAYLQSVTIAPLALNQAPLVAGARAVAGGDLTLVVLAKGGGAMLLDSATYATGPCDELQWRHLQGCDTCDVPNCVVLATIVNYQAGAAISDPPTPPDTTANDVANRIARIDNRQGRRILLNTQTLQAWIACIEAKAGGGQQGPQGPQGPPGQNGQNGGPGPQGDPGPGLESGLTRINFISWRHNTHGNDFARIRVRGAVHPGLVIGFTGPVGFADAVRPIDAGHVFEVLLRDRRPDVPLLCRCAALGTVLPVAPLPTPAPTDFEAITQPVSDFWAFLFTGRSVADWARESDEVWVKLRGDFVIDSSRRAIDAEFVRAMLPTGDRPAGSGFGVQGGLFESWFWLREGPNEIGIAPAVDVNRANAQELAAVPGITAASAERIVAARARRPFVSAADFRRRVRPSDRAWGLMQSLITFQPPEA
jgi:hypothetical protein